MYSILRVVRRDYTKATDTMTIENITAKPAVEVTACITANEAFGISWGADGQVLTHAETCEAIAKRQGWFDRSGHWVNKAGWEKEHAGLGDWLIAKLAN